MKIIKVKLWGTTIGYLKRNETGIYSFQYDTGFLKSGIEVSPVMMPLSSKTYSFPSLPENTFKGLPGLLVDYLPDRDGRIMQGALKFEPDLKQSKVEINEDTKIKSAYTFMAKAAGIKVNDNIFTGKKYHLQSLCALAHMDCNSPRLYSYEDAFRILRFLGSGYKDYLQLFRIMVFNEYAKNYNDHTKSIIYMMNKKGEWSLAPAYNLTLAYSKDSIWTRVHQLLINKKASNLTEKDFMKVAKNTDIKYADAAECIEQVEDAVLKWKEFAEQAELTKNKTNQIRKIIKH